MVDEISVLTLSKDDLDETGKSSRGLDILHEILQEANEIHGGGASNDGQGVFKTQSRQSKQNDSNLDPLRDLAQSSSFGFAKINLGGTHMEKLGKDDFF